MLGLNFLIENCVIDILIVCRFYVFLLIITLNDFLNYSKKRKKRKQCTERNALIRDTSCDSPDGSLMCTLYVWRSALFEARGQERQ